VGVRVKWIFLSTLPIKIVLLRRLKTRNLDAGDISWDVKKVDHIDKCKLFLPYKKLYEEILINVIFQFLMEASAICEKLPERV
jgi:hypothetical protein